MSTSLKEHSTGAAHRNKSAPEKVSQPLNAAWLAAVLAFIPLTHSVFWGSMAYVLIGGTAVGTVLTLAFLPALYAIWFRVNYADAVRCNHAEQSAAVADLIYEHTA